MLKAAWARSAHPTRLDDDVGWVERSDTQQTKWQTMGIALLNPSYRAPSLPLSGEEHCYPPDKGKLKGVLDLIFLNPS